MDFLTFASVCVIVLPGYALLYWWSFWFFQTSGAITKTISKIHRKAGREKKAKFMCKILEDIDAIMSGRKYNIESIGEKLINNPIVFKLLDIVGV